MELMPRIRVCATIVLILVATGCSSSDERLAELSERAAQRQHEQNQLIAQQSHDVLAENQRIAIAAQALVAADAKARREMVRAHESLQSQFHAERSAVDLQRADLEAERRDIAAQRARDPIIAATLEGVFTLLACLTPFVIVAYALSRFDRIPVEVDELAEVLLQELVVIYQSPNLPLARPALSAPKSAEQESTAPSTD